MKTDGSRYYYTGEEVAAILRGEYPRDVPTLKSNRSGMTVEQTPLTAEQIVEIVRAMDGIPDDTGAKP